MNKKMKSNKCLSRLWIKEQKKKLGGAQNIYGTLAGVPVAKSMQQRHNSRGETQRESR